MEKIYYCSKCKKLKENQKNYGYCRKCDKTYRKFLYHLTPEKKEKLIKIKKKRNNECSRCNSIVEVESKRYCRKCNASYARQWRKTHPLSKQQRFKNIVRRKTGMRIKRGLLIRQPCEVCGETKVQAHHDDYNKPYNVRWLCFIHHSEHHKKERQGCQKRIVPLKTLNKHVLLLG